MKMEIIESDLKQLFQWTKTCSDALKVIEELCKSQNVLIEQHQDAIESLEERIINIELLLTQEDNK
jgi:hypothetical protein